MLGFSFLLVIVAFSLVIIYYRNFTKQIDYWDSCKIVYLSLVSTNQLSVYLILILINQVATITSEPHIQTTVNVVTRGCFCSVDGYRALVERFLEVEVRGLDRDGKPMKVDACGWQARILQHECDHLDGTLYVDKMVKRTFRTIDNLDLPLAKGCPKQGVY